MELVKKLDFCSHSLPPVFSTTPVVLSDQSVIQWMDGEWTVHCETKVADFLLDSYNNVL